MSMRTNYIVLERDIHYLGGTVSYTGNIISRSVGKFVEEAVVSLGDVTCKVYMERYTQGGTGVVAHFVDEKDGHAKHYTKIDSARLFLERFGMLMLDDEDYMSFSYTQRVKKLLVIFLQVILVLNVLFSFYLFVLRGFHLFIFMNLCISLLVIGLLDRFHYHFNNDDFDAFRQRMREYEKE